MYIFTLSFRHSLTRDRSKLVLLCAPKDFERQEERQIRSNRTLRSNKRRSKHRCVLRVMARVLRERTRQRNYSFLNERVCVAFQRERAGWWIINCRPFICTVAATGPRNGLRGFRLKQPRRVATRRVRRNTIVFYARRTPAAIAPVVARLIFVLSRAELMGIKSKLILIRRDFCRNQSGRTISPGSRRTSDMPGEMHTIFCVCNLR